MEEDGWMDGWMDRIDVDGIDRIDGSFEVDGCVLCRWALLAEKTE